MGKILGLCDKACTSDTNDLVTWDDFLRNWYSAPLWGNVKQNHTSFSDMITRRSQALGSRGRDIAKILRSCSPALNSQDMTRFCKDDEILYIAGELDSKYSAIGQKWM